MKRIEWFALVLVVLWFVAFLVPKYIGIFVVPRQIEMQELGHLKLFTMLIAYSQYGITRLVQIGVAVWLFLSARRGNETPWVWALLGLTYGVFGALLFFVLRIYERLGRREDTCADHTSDDIVANRSRTSK